MPQLRDYYSLPGYIIAAAKCAYKRVPQAYEYADLLRDYYESPLSVDREHIPFQRPVDVDFFLELEDVISLQAVRWAKLVGWSPRPSHAKVSVVMEKRRRMELLSDAAEKAAAAGHTARMVGCIKALDKMGGLCNSREDSKYSKVKINKELEDFRKKFPKLARSEGFREEEDEVDDEEELEDGGCDNSEN